MFVFWKNRSIGKVKVFFCFFNNSCCCLYFVATGIEPPVIAGHNDLNMWSALFIPVRSDNETNKNTHTIDHQTTRNTPPRITRDCGRLRPLPGCRRLWYEPIVIRSSSYRIRYKNLHRKRKLRPMCTVYETILSTHRHRPPIPCTTWENYCGPKDLIYCWNCKTITRNGRASILKWTFTGADRIKMPFKEPFTDDANQQHCREPFRNFDNKPFRPNFGVVSITGNWYPTRSLSIPAFPKSSVRPRRKHWPWGNLPSSRTIHPIISFCNSPIVWRIEIKPSLLPISVGP